MNTRFGKISVVLFFFTILAAVVIVPHKAYSQSTTIIVAASNADSATKSSTNYVADGTDDQVEIQQAIDSLGTTGGTVILSNGTFNLSSSIVVKQNIILQGQGAQTVLQASSDLSGQFIRVNGPDSRISSLIIDDGRTAGQGPQTNGIHIWSGNEIRLANVIIESVHIRRLQSGINGSDAISTNYTQNIGFQNNNIENVSGSGLIFYKTDNSVMTGNLINNLGKDGIILSESNGSKAINNSVSNVKYSGIVFGESNDASASGNLVSMTGNHGIISTLGGNRNTFTNNTVKQTGANGTGGFSHGIAIDGNEGKTPSSGHKIVNNYIENSYDAGIEVADSVDNVLISGNTVNGAGLGPHPNNTYGIYFGGGFTPCHLATISGNKVTRAKENGIEFGSQPGHDLTTNVVVEGNETYNNGSNGIFANYAKNFTIKNNSCYNNDQTQTDKDGIRLQDSSYGVVNSNHCYDSQTVKTQNNGLVFMGKVDNINVYSNNFKGNQFGEIYTDVHATVSNISYDIPHGSSADWGLIANDGFQKQKIISTLFFAGPPNPGAFPNYTRHPQNTEQYNWEHDDDINSILNKIKNIGINVLKVSYWGHNGETDKWATTLLFSSKDWNNANVVLSENDIVGKARHFFELTSQKQILFAPLIEVSPEFPFYAQFPGNLDNLVNKISWLVNNFATENNWLKVYNKDGEPRLAIWLIETIHSGSVDSSAFAQAFDETARRVEQNTGIKIGFIIDPTPLPPYSSHEGPDPAVLAQRQSILAVNPFNITSQGLSGNP